MQKPPNLSKEQGLKKKDLNRANPASQPTPRPSSSLRRDLGVVAIVLPLAAACLALFFWWPRATKSASHDSPAGPPNTEANGSLLQQMTQGRLPDEADLSGPVATNEQLEAQYSTITQNQEQLGKLKNDAAAAAGAKNAGEVKRDVERGKPLVTFLNLRLA